jgi:hypothetical protein
MRAAARGFEPNTDIVLELADGLRLIHWHTCCLVLSQTHFIL